MVVARLARMKIHANEGLSMFDLGVVVAAESRFVTIGGQNCVLAFIFHSRPRISFASLLEQSRGALMARLLVLTALFFSSALLEFTE